MSIMLFLIAAIGFVIFLGGAALLATAIYHVRKESLAHQQDEAGAHGVDRMAA